mmetsp:Transcript_70920/g.189367  ORF Transcript_70920/g.189367 Transcript_70920/m.189367 type:complete len:261 (+) Transcript_70920:50-832(+)
MRPGRRWDSVGNFLRSDDRFYFFLAAFVFTASVLYTIFGQLIPAIQNYNVYTYAHCTVTGAGHWEKYGTWTGISERVVVPVEIRIGGFQGALNWDGNGTQIYASRDAYHQAIARDAPLGWKYFTVNDKIDYLHQYQPGHEYECWALPSEQFHEAVFHKQPGFERMIPQIIFLVIVVGLCMATGVCLGIVDMCRALVGLSELEPETADVEAPVHPVGPHQHRPVRMMGSVGGGPPAAAYAHHGGPPPPVVVVQKGRDQDYF